MAFASAADRLALQTADFRLEFTVQILARNGSEVELAADDVDHALAICRDWLNRGAEWAEIFRVNDDGSLRPTVGRFRKEV